MDLILGTAQFAMSYGQFRDRRQYLNVNHLLETAQNIGFTAVDTALAYQGAEEAIGRSAWRGYVHTKIEHGNSPKELLSESLKRLRRDAVEVLYFHNPTILENSKSYFGGVRAAIRRSHARMLGVSVYTPEEMKRALAIGAIEAIQLPVNVADGRFSRALFLEAENKGVKLFARSIFLQGALLQNVRELPRYLAPIRPTVEVMRQITNFSGLTPTHLAMGWAKSLPGVGGVVVGAETESQLLDISQAFLSPSLSGDILAQLATVQITDEEALDPRKWPA